MNFILLKGTNEPIQIPIYPWATMRNQIKSQRLATAFGDAPSPQTPEQIDVIKRLSITLSRK